MSESERVKYLKEHVNGRSVLKVENCLEKTYVTSCYAGDVSLLVITEDNGGSISIGQR